MTEVYAFMEEVNRERQLAITPNAEDLECSMKLYEQVFSKWKFFFSPHIIKLLS